MEFLNVDGRLTGLTAGELLTVPKDGNKGNSAAREGIHLILRDALGARISGETVDSGKPLRERLLLLDRPPVLELTFELDSKWIAGTRRYKAVNGTVRINETYVVGYDVSETLVLQSDDNRNLSAVVNLTTLPCSRGELPTRPKTECFRCPVQSYSFQATVDACQPCEDHANCAGTTQLVPDDGYWHSTPFSPFIRRCPIRNACSFDNRAKILARYYNNSTDILAKVDCYKTSSKTVSEKCPEAYEQCSKGYQGVLCGTCAKGYGHSATGECRKCNQSLAVARVATVLTVVLLYLVLSGKVFLGVDSVKQYVARSLEGKRHAVRNVLLHGMANSSRAIHREQPLTGGNETVSLSTTSQVEVRPNSSDNAREEGSSASKTTEKPRLRRTKEHIEDPLSDGGTSAHVLPSVPLSAASNILTITFNVSSLSWPRRQKLGMSVDPVQLRSSEHGSA